MSKFNPKQFPADAPEAWGRGRARETRHKAPDDGNRWLALPSPPIRAALPPPPPPDRNETRSAKHDGDSDKDNPDSLGRMEEEGQEQDLPKNLPKVPTRRILIIAAVFLVILIGLFLAGYIPHRHRTARLEQQSRSVQDARPSVEIVQPRRTSADARLQLPGNALPLQQTSIFPRANGYLKTLYVDIGDRVTRGQLLADIDTPEIDAQLAAARANEQQAQANVTRAQTDYDLAAATLTRYQGLFQTGGVTQQQLDERQNAFNQAKGTLEANKAATVSAAAEVQRLSALQGYEKVFAPFDGVVTTRNFDVGALLNPANSGANQQLFDIERTDILRVFVDVPQSYATSITINHPATFDVRNYPGRPFEGKVARSAGALDPRTRTLRMEVDFPNSSGTLLAGMYGQVTLEVPRATPQLVIPTSSLIFNAQGLRVAIVDDQHKSHFRPITVGRDFGTEVEVTGGLTGNEQIITNPGEQLAEGVEVNPTQAHDEGSDAQSQGGSGQSKSRKDKDTGDQGKAPQNAP